MPSVSQLFEKNRELTPSIVMFSLLVFFGVLFAILIVKWIAGFLNKRISESHTLRKEFLGTIGDISWYTCLIFPVFFASLSFAFIKPIRIGIALIFIIDLVIEITSLIKVLLKLVMEKGFRHQDAKTKKNLYEILNTIFQIMVWILAVLIVFDTIGIAITPILTSLGIGGIAVAFAAQKLLEDFFSSFSIMGSTPFRIGDRIEVAGYEGTVKKIGLRTTTLQTIKGSTVVIPNRSVVADCIENSGLIKVRRKRFSLAITYETPVEKLKAIPDILKKIISKQEKTTFEWALLKDLQDSSIEVLVSYTVSSDDLLFSMKVHDAILLEILDTFKQEGIDFAYPTQTLYTKGL